LLSILKPDTFRFPFVPLVPTLYDDDVTDSPSHVYTFDVRCCVRNAVVLLPLFTVGCAFYYPVAGLRCTFELRAFAFCRYCNFALFAYSIGRFTAVVACAATVCVLRTVRVDRILLRLVI